MIFLGSMVEITPSKHRVLFQHHMPFDETNGMGLSQAQLESMGILIEALPDSTPADGKYSILYYNPITGDLWYEYEDIPKSVEEIRDEEIEQLRLRIAQAQDDVLFLFETIFE